MNRILFTAYRIIVPKPIRTFIVKKSLHKKIFAYYSDYPEKVNAEITDVLSYLKKKPLTIFPYPFENNYLPENVRVFNDTDKGMRYVLFEGKRLYFKKRWSEKRIKKGFSDLLREQDSQSPHCYLTEGFGIKEDDVIADIGAAEGNFSLSVVEKAKRIYIFEYNREWAEALRHTFAPWKDKVEIINKKVADFDDGEHIKFDTFLKEREGITFLKIDVDGAEKQVLASSRELLKGSGPLRIALCTYHRNADENDFTALLTGYGFSVKPSMGYMIHYYDKQISAPYLRRGLIRGIKA